MSPELPITNKYPTDLPISIEYILAADPIIVSGYVELKVTNPKGDIMTIQLHDYTKEQIDALNLHVGATVILDFLI